MWTLFLALAVTPQTGLEEAKQICTEDAGRLWGKSLCGPFILADSTTRRVYANQADANGVLKQEGDLWTGTLPAGVGIANTATEWSGTFWTMVGLPLPDDPARRRRLLAHEMYHRIQNEVQRAPRDATNEHLETEPGRVLLRLEFRALDAALAAGGDDRRQAVTDALAFRAERWRLFPDARRQETALEAGEGLAEYTGFALDGLPLEKKIAAAREQLRAERPTYVRSFAYISGPAWGLLLDDADPGWPRRIGVWVDLAQRVADASQLKLDPLIAAERSLFYNAPAIRKEEAARAKTIADRRASYKARFIDGPTLKLTFTPKMSFTFNPNRVETLPGEGTVYPTMEVSDEWGTLHVTGGALMGRSWESVRVPLAEEGKSWTLDLKPGWERKGNTVAPTR